MAVRTKKDAARVLSEVEGEKRFFCCEGSVINSLSQLADCLGYINDECYGYHVSADKNDFGNWVDLVIGDNKLSGDVRNAASRTEAAEIVRARVTWLHNKVKK